MSSIPDSSIPALTPLEKIGPKGYLQYIFLFELPQSYDTQEIVHILRVGYYAASKIFIPLICEALPDIEARPAGVWKLRRIEDENLDVIAFKDSRDPGAFPFTFAELKAEFFPVSAFDTDDIMRRHVWPQPGDRLPVSQIKATFIQGGLVLGWSLLHMFGDGKTFSLWMHVLAEECRRAQNLDILKPIELPQAIFKDRELLMKSSGRNPGRLEDHKEYTLLPFTPQGMPPKMLSKNHRGQVFYFSPNALQALKSEAWPDKATTPTTQKWISTNDALSALLWRTIMAVQFPLDTLEGDPVSTFNIAIDGRSRTSPPLHPETLGCFLEYVAPSLPIREMLSTLSLADIALKVRQAVLRADKEWTDDIIALIEKHVEDVDRLVPTAFLDVPGFHCVQTSWVNFTLYDIDWGHALGNNIQAVRSPSCGVLNGLQVIFPILPDGGLEVLVGVEDSYLDRLLCEPLWNKFAKAR
ncbi:trichothecene 3-o-acetyltransferase [Thozetella sp. PMI_491]|nr:trichothecene 3-o-acetyltransferase [Thozetella sp. PMI_491]